MSRGLVVQFFLGYCEIHKQITVYVENKKMPFRMSIVRSNMLFYNIPFTQDKQKKKKIHWTIFCPEN